MSVLIGKTFAEDYDFVAPAIMPDGDIEQSFSFSERIQGKYAVLMFYSLNFSFVCPTEMIAISNRFKAFQSRNTEVVVVSSDSYLSHQEWRNKPVELGGIGEFPFPMVSDTSRGIARGYGCLVNESIALRATFVIDKDGYFRHQSVNDIPIGRNIDEVLRIIDGLQSYQQTGKLCPAGWKSGDETLTALPDELSDFMSRNAANL